MINGLLLINKPEGPTSHDVVTRLRYIFGQRRIGHTGTLDPMASGLLVMLLGQATRLLPYLENDDKEYEGTITLGIATDTLDAAGKVIKRQDCQVDIDEIHRAASSLTGKLMQKPPMVSAVKIGGRPLYGLAREGKEVERADRPVEVFAFDITDIRSESKNPEVDFRVHCSKGTYIRVLASDLGEKIGCWAHLSRLVRTKVGIFTLSEALKIEELAKTGEPEKNIISMRAILPDFLEMTVDAAGQNDVANGRPILAGRVIRMAGRPVDAGRPLKVLNDHDELLCIAEALAEISSSSEYTPDKKIAKPVTVFHTI